MNAPAGAAPLPEVTAPTTAPIPVDAPPAPPGPAYAEALGAPAGASPAVGRRIVRLIESVSGMAAWLYLYLIALLGAWVVIAMLLTGWMPVVISSGSMQPTLRPGDIVLLDEHPPDLLAQRNVITYTDPDGSGELITHRVHAVDDDGYVTKGDANPTPDTSKVAVDSIEGVARLVVPLVGLPLLWLERGDTGSLVAWGVLSVGALVVAFARVRRYRRDGDQRERARHTPAAGRAIRRVRTLVAAMIVGQFVIDSSRFEISGVALAPWQLLAGSLGMLALINTASFLTARSDDSRQVARMSMLELVGDTVMVIALTTATGTSGIGWVLFALPIIEAAARFRLSGALVHWMVLTGIALASRVWMIERTPGATTELIGELERVLDQLSVLLLVVIPGAHLIEQLTSDVLAQRKVTERAVERGRMLEHVADVSRDINRIGSEVFEAIAEAVQAVGFDRTDVAMRVGDDWVILQAAGTTGPPLPTPGEPGSGLRPADLDLREVAVTSDDHDHDDATALEALGVGYLARLTLTDRDDAMIVLRAMVADPATLRTGGIEALRLLAGQATVALQNERLITELQSVHDEMERQANHDSLTGLPNRAHFVARLEAAVAAATDPDRRHVVLFMDLDGFKPVNDDLGHDIGDRLLEAVATRLDTIVGARGFVARLGGDEFTALLNPVASPAEAEKIAKEIRDATSAPYRIGPHVVTVAASVGMAYSGAGLSAGELLRRADAAMYAAKAQKAVVPFVVYHTDLDANDRREARLADEFVKAMRSDELELHYQPVLRADHGLCGVEALLRWNHRDLGSVSVASMLQVAERSRLVPELNRWILGRAARDIRSLGLPPDGDFFVAVNASPTELASEFLAMNVANALEVSGLAAHNLVIELSERIVTGDISHADNLLRLSGLGVQLALDDFGSGSTSLAHLRGLPISMLKIDKVLVQQAAMSHPDRVILDSVVNLAHGLGLLVVAEGLETEEHRAATVEAGADLLQGYLLHRPMPLASLRAVLAQVGTAAVPAIPKPAVTARTTMERAAATVGSGSIS